MNYKFEVLDWSQADEAELNQGPRKSVFRTAEWMRFLVEDSGVKPIVLRILKDNILRGYFVGGLISKFGVRIIGSPFDGWSTCFMGFDMESPEEKLAVVPELYRYLYKSYHCHFIQIADRDFSEPLVKSAGLQYVLSNTLELNIDRKTNEELFKVFKTDCRNFIRQFERRGAAIRVCKPNDAFAETYYEQLKDVFAKQDMVPTYSVDKVKHLLKHLNIMGVGLCLEVYLPEDNTSIATSIFFCDTERFYYWGGASFRAYQHYRPNEYMLWTAIQHFRDSGCKVFDMVGVRDYKKKFGSHEVDYCSLHSEKYKILVPLKNMAKKLYFRRLKAKSAPGQGETHANTG